MMNSSDNLKNSKNNSFLNFLYNTVMGRILLKILINKRISNICGRYLDSKSSKILIRQFIQKNNIDMSEYENASYNCFNDFFTRQIKKDYRPIDIIKDDFIAPCDGLISIYNINSDTIIPVKQSNYSISELIKGYDSKIFNDGICVVFRLCVNHYHRYCYIDNLTKSNNFFIDGKLHTVRPIALKRCPVFTENCREYTIMNTENFGTVAQIEVGAMLVGKIKNHHQQGSFKRGEEKGMFLYGGSTIILLVQKNKVAFSQDLFENTKLEIDTPVKMGECIGKLIS